MPFYHQKIPPNAKKEKEFAEQMFGVNKESNLPNSEVNPNNMQMTAQQAQEMQEILLKYHRDNAHKVVDLSKPPIVPYNYKKFPMMVYNHASSKAGHHKVIKNQLGQEQTEYVDWKCQTKTVHNEGELQAALVAGWKQEAPTNRYEGETVEEMGEIFTGAEPEVINVPILPDFSTMTKERLIAYGFAMFGLSIPAITKKDEVVALIEKAASESVQEPVEQS